MSPDHSAITLGNVTPVPAIEVNTIDKIYIYTYSALRKASSRHNARVGAAFAVWVIIIEHLLGLTYLISVLSPINLLAALGKFGTIAVGLLVLLTIVSRYLIGDRADRLIGNSADEIKRGRTMIVGALLVLWGFLFLFLCIGILSLLHAYHHS